MSCFFLYKTNSWAPSKACQLQFLLQTANKTEIFFVGVGMENFHVIFIALVSVIAFNPNVVYGNFYKSTVFNWGAQHSSVSSDGNDLQLVLDRISGIISLILILNSVKMIPICQSLACVGP